MSSNPNSGTLGCSRVRSFYRRMLPIGVISRVVLSRGTLCRRTLSSYDGRFPTAPGMVCKHLSWNGPWPLLRQLCFEDAELLHGRPLTQASQGLHRNSGTDQADAILASFWKLLILKEYIQCLIYTGRGYEGANSNAGKYA
jgi:hypothetical protein